MNLSIELDREEDGRWIAEIPEIPGVMAYGQAREEAVAKAQALALRVLAERLEFSVPSPFCCDRPLFTRHNQHRGKTAADAPKLVWRRSNRSTRFSQN